MKKFYFIIITTFFTCTLTAQIGIGTNTPDTTAQLDVYSTSKGFLMPRMNTIQRKNINKPAIGLMVFDTDKNSLYFFDGAKWAAIGSFAEKDVLPFSRVLTNSQVNDHLGFSVAMDSLYAFIGAPFDSLNGSGKQGAVYILKKDAATGWQFQTKLTATDVGAGDYFGYSVAIKGDYAIVGTYNSATPGAAHIFNRHGDTWVQQAKLTASDAAVGDLFGAAVGIYDNYAVVGAPKDDIDTSTDCGSAYFFLRTGTTWTEEVKLVAPGKKSNDEFGKTLSFYGTHLLVGAPGDSGEVPLNSSLMYYSGSAYPFARIGNVWTPLRKLREPVNGPVIWPGIFANAVAISDNYAAISDYGGNATYMYRYTDTGLVYESTLYPTSASFFGKAISISGDYLSISAVVPLPPGLSQAGNVLCYKRNGTAWTLISTINKVDASSGNFTLGRSVAIDGKTLDVLMGAPGSFSGSEINQNVPVKGTFYFANLQ